MVDVEVRDVLLRVGGRTLQRTGFLAAAGAGRGYVEVKEIFARAASSLAIDRSGYLKNVAAGAPRIEWPPGLVDVAGNPLCGIRGDTAVTNKLTTPEGPYNAGAWTSAGCTVPSTNNPSPRLGLLGTPDLTANFVREDTSTGVHGLFQNYTIGASNKRGAYVLIKSVGSRTKGRLRITNPSGTEASVVFDLSAGTISSGTDWAGIIPLAGGWFAICVFGGAGAGNPGAQFGVVFRDASNNESYTGDGASGFLITGCVATDNQFVLHYWGTGAASVSDNFTLPVNFGPTDVTVLQLVARPIHADAVGDIGIEPATFKLGSGKLIRGNFQQTTRLMRAFIGTNGGTDVQQTVAIPAGGLLTIVSQFRNLATTGGITKLDVGSGFTADSPTATAYSAFGSQTLEVGSNGSLHLLCGVLVDLVFARGLRTLAEMQAIP